MRLPASLILAALLFAALRLALLETRPDTVSMPVYELATIGNLAAVTVSGEGTAPLALYYDNCGGHLVTGLAAAGVYRVLGESYFALKLVPLTFGLVALCLVWRIADRFFGRGAATVAAFAFALAPPTLLKYSLLAKGNHFENLPFQLGLVLLALGIESSRARRTRLFAAAASAGLATFVYFGSLVMVAALAVTHLATAGWKRALRDAPLAAVGFALGVAPLGWVDRASAGQARAFASAKLAGAEGWLDGFCARISGFLTEVAPRAGGFEPFAGLPAALAEWTFLAAFVLAWCAAASALLARGDGARDARRARLPFVLYPLGFLVAVGASTFDFDAYAPPVEVGRFRYLVPHFAFATILAGAAVAWAWRRRGAWRAAGATLAGALLGANLFSLTLVDWSFAQTGVARLYPGSWFHYYPNVALKPTRIEPDGRPTWDPAGVARNVSRLAAPHRRDVYEGVGQREAQVRFSDGARELQAEWLERTLARYDAAFAVDLARGIGMFLRRWDQRPEQREKLARSLAALDASGSPWAEYVVEGLCLEFAFPAVSTSLADVNRSILLGELVPQGLRAAWLRGRGIQLGRLLRRGIPSEVAMVLERAEVVVAEERAPLWFGLGSGLADATLDARFPPSVFEWVIPSDRAAFFAGYGAGVRQAWKAEAGERRDPVLFGLAPEHAREVRRGLEWIEYPAPVSL